MFEFIYQLNGKIWILTYYREYFYFYFIHRGKVIKNFSSEYTRENIHELPPLVKSNNVYFTVTGDPKKKQKHLRNR